MLRNAEKRVLVSVDVGLHGLGLAAWGDDGLLAGWYVPAEKKERGAAAWLRLARSVPGELACGALVVETMVHYEGSRVDPSDLMELQGIAGCLVAVHPWTEVHNVEARTWSEGIPKDVRHARLERTLEKRGWTSKIDVPRQKARLSDVYDAVGLGLWWTESRSTRRWRTSERF